MKIGKLINSRRTELGLTLEEVGNAVGVSKSTVKKWEDGFISNMRRDKIAKLATVLQLDPVAFITDEIAIIDKLRNASGTIAQNIKKIRDKLEMTSDELAKKANLPLEVVEQYETGATTVDPNELRSIADALEISIAELTEIPLPYYVLSDEEKDFFYRNVPSKSELESEINLKMISDIFPDDDGTAQKLLSVIKKMSQEERKQLLGFSDYLISLKLKDDQ